MDNQVIYKYPVPFGPPVTHKMKRRGFVVLVGEQNGTPMVWICHYGKTDLDVERRYYIVATGEPFDADHSEHIGSFQSGQMVWHIIEDRK